MSPVLELDCICSGYGAIGVLHEVSLTVNDAETVMLLGPNGHGKTTLARTISGTVRATSGSIRLDGRAIENLDPAEIVRAGVAHIPQGDLLFGEMTVRDNLLAAAAVDRKSWRRRNSRLSEVLEIFPRLSERSRQLATTLSGGERRMLGIGRGLMSRSDLLIIDEPSLGLAPLVVTEVYDRIRQLSESGTAILLIEEGTNHLGLADRVYVLENGRVAGETARGERLDRRELLDTYFFGATRL